MDRRASRQLVESRVRIANLKEKLLEKNKKIAAGLAREENLEKKVENSELQCLLKNERILILEKKIKKMKIKMAKKKDKINSLKNQIMFLLKQCKEKEMAAIQLHKEKKILQIDIRKAKLQKLDPLSPEMVSKTDEIVDDLLMILEADA